MFKHILISSVHPKMHVSPHLLIIYLFTFGYDGSCFCSGFSLVVASEGHSLATMRGLLIVGASFVLDHRL